LTANPIHFVHLTDLHISHPETCDPHLLTDTPATLRQVVDALGRLSPKPAFVVVSGDITNHGDAASYRLAREIMSKIDVPIVYALGNHDNRMAFRAEMLGLADGGGAPYCHDQLIAGVHVIVLDSSVPGRISGAISPDQFAFLEQALTLRTDFPKLLVIHHPPALEDDPEFRWESINPADTRRLADALRGHRVVGILSGHTHFDRVIHWNGVPVIVGTGLHNGVDITYSDGMRIVDAAGYALCTLRPSGLSAVFVQLERNRRELAILPAERLRAFE